MSDARRIPGSSVSERLCAREVRRLRVGPSPLFYERFGLADPWAGEETQSEGMFSFLSAAPYYARLRAQRAAMARARRRLMERLGDANSRAASLGTRVAQRLSSGGGLVSSLAFGELRALSDSAMLVPEAAAVDADAEADSHDGQGRSRRERQVGGFHKAQPRQNPVDPRLLRALERLGLGTSGVAIEEIVQELEQLNHAQQATVVRRVVRKTRGVASRAVMGLVDEVAVEQGGRPAGVARSRGRWAQAAPVSRAARGASQGLRPMLASSPALQTLYFEPQVPVAVEPRAEIPRTRQDVTPRVSSASARPLAVASVQQAARRQEVPSRAGPAATVGGAAPAASGARAVDAPVPEVMASSVESAASTPTPLKQMRRATARAAARVVAQSGASDWGLPQYDDAGLPMAERSPVVARAARRAVVAPQGDATAVRSIVPRPAASARPLRASVSLQLPATAEHDSQVEASASRPARVVTAGAAARSTQPRPARTAQVSRGAQGLEQAQTPSTPASHAVGSASPVRSAGSGRSPSAGESQIAASAAVDASPVSAAAASRRLPSVVRAAQRSEATHRVDRRGRALLSAAPVVEPDLQITSAGAPRHVAPTAPREGVAAQARVSARAITALPSELTDVRTSGAPLVSSAWTPVVQSVSPVERVAQRAEVAQAPVELASRSVVPRPGLAARRQLSTAGQPLVLPQAAEALSQEVGVIGSRSARAASVSQSPTSQRARTAVGARADQTSVVSRPSRDRVSAEVDTSSGLPPRVRGAVASSVSAPSAAPLDRGFQVSPVVRATQRAMAQQVGVAMGGLAPNPVAYVAPPAQLLAPQVVSEEASAVAARPARVKAARTVEAPSAGSPRSVPQVEDAPRRAARFVQSARVAVRSARSVSDVRQIVGEVAAPLSSASRATGVEASPSASSRPVVRARIQQASAPLRRLEAQESAADSAPVPAVARRSSLVTAAPTAYVQAPSSQAGSDTAVVASRPSRSIVPRAVPRLRTQAQEAVSAVQAELAGRPSRARGPLAPPQDKARRSVGEKAAGTSVFSAVGASQESAPAAVRAAGRTATVSGAAMLDAAVDERAPARAAIERATAVRRALQRFEHGRTEAQAPRQLLSQSPTAYLAASPVISEVLGGATEMRSAPARPPSAAPVAAEAGGKVASRRGITPTGDGAVVEQHDAHVGAVSRPARRLGASRLAVARSSLVGGFDPTHIVSPSLVEQADGRVVRATRPERAGTPKRGRVAPRAVSAASASSTVDSVEGRVLAILRTVLRAATRSEHPVTAAPSVRRAVMGLDSPLMHMAAQQLAEQTSFEGASAPGRVRASRAIGERVLDVGPLAQALDVAQGAVPTPARRIAGVRGAEARFLAPHVVPGEVAPVEAYGVARRSRTSRLARQAYPAVIAAHTESGGEVVSSSPSRRVAAPRGTGRQAWSPLRRVLERRSSVVAPTKRQAERVSASPFAVPQPTFVASLPEWSQSYELVSDGGPGVVAPRQQPSRLAKTLDYVVSGRVDDVSTGAEPSVARGSGGPRLRKDVAGRYVAPERLARRQRSRAVASGAPQAHLAAAFETGAPEGFTDAAMAPRSGARVAGWGQRARGVSPALPEETFASTTPGVTLKSGRLLTALARARQPEEILRVILERSTESASMARHLPSPVAALVERIVQAGQEVTAASPLDEQRPNATTLKSDEVFKPVYRGTKQERPRSTPAFKTLSRPATGARAVDGGGASSAMKLAGKLQKLILLAESDRRSAREHVRMAEADGASHAAADGASAAPKKAVPSMHELERDVLESVLRELELTLVRNQGDPDGWW